MNRTLGVLISGRGTNLQAILDAVADGRLDARVAVVLSDRRDAPGLERARRAGVDAEFLDPRAYEGRREYETALVQALRDRRVGLVCLAGFMRVLGPDFLQAFPGAILNIHPSLLPAFPGLDAQRQAWAYGVRVAGATVHFVTEQVDGGPIILQAPVPVLDDDTPETLAARILVEEHRLYPRAIQIVLDGAFRIEGRRVILTVRP